MVDNDNACEPDKRGVLESIASKLAPTVPRDCVKNLKKANTRWLLAVRKMGYTTDDNTKEVTVFSTPGNAAISVQTLCTRCGLAAPTRSIKSNSPLMTSH